MAFQFPNNPTIGQSVLNPTSSQYYTWNGTAWTQYPTSASYAISSSYSVTSSYAVNGGGGGATITISDSAPTGSAATTGSMWFNSDNLGLYVRYQDTDSTQWVAASAVGPVSTASFAQTASFVATSSFAQTSTSSSFAQTASFVATSSFAQTSTSSSFARTSSFAIQAATYLLPNTTTTQWVFLGEWSTINSGATLYMRVVSHAGFNADITQNQVTELYFKTSNGISFQTGVIGGQFYGDGLAFRNTSLGPNTQVPESFRIVQVSNTRYFIYGFFNAGYIDNSTYQVQIPPNTTWINSSTVVGAPSGTYINITPSAGKAYASWTVTSANTTTNTAFAVATSVANGVTVTGGNTFILANPGVYYLSANLQLRSTYAVYYWSDTSGNRLTGCIDGLSVSATSSDPASPNQASGIFVTTGFNTQIQVRLGNNSGLVTSFQTGAGGQIIQLA